MQPDQITLSVDEENDGVGPVDHVYSRFESHLNRSVYVGPGHAISSKNTLSLYRTAPKPSGNFRGVAKTAVKFSEDLLVDGVDGVAQITAPIIIDVSFSIPVGATHAAILKARQRALSLLDYDTVMTPLNETLMI